MQHQGFPVKMTMIQHYLMYQTVNTRPGGIFSNPLYTNPDILQFFDPENEQPGYQNCLCVGKIFKIPVFSPTRKYFSIFTLSYVPSERRGETLVTLKTIEEKMDHVVLIYC